MSLLIYFLFFMSAFFRWSLLKVLGKQLLFSFMCCLSKAARDHLEIKQNLQIYPIILSYMSFEGVRLQLGRKFCCHPLSPSSPLPIYVLLFSFIIRDRMIQQRQSPWKRCWKIDFTSFKTILRLSQIALLLEGREFLEVRGGPHLSSDRDGIIYRLAVSVHKYRVVQGTQRDWQKSMMHVQSCWFAH